MYSMVDKKMTVIFLRQYQWHMEASEHKCVYGKEMTNRMFLHGRAQFFHRFCGNDHESGPASRITL